MKSNTASYAQRELDILVKSSTDPNNRPIIEPFIPEILALTEKFGLSGQSGGSAPYTAAAITQALKKLLLQRPIMPITGIAEEWMDVAKYAGKNEAECIWQNNRCSALFKNLKEQAWYLDAIIWKEENGSCYSGSAWLPNGEDVFYSRQLVKSFPFTPKTFYIDVIKQILPADWTQEPFIEWDYYSAKDFEETGEKVWKTEKYRNIVKDSKQLNRVFKYYDRYEF